MEGSWLAIRREWLVVVHPEELERLRRKGVEIIETTTYGNLDMTLARVRVGEDLDAREALEPLLSKGQAVDRNHTYSYSPQSGAPEGERAVSRRAPVCSREVAIGVIDTGVDEDHPALAGARLSQRDFLPGDVEVSREHGSAVAGLLVGRSGGFRGAAPRARLSVASVMYLRQDGSQGATAMSLVQALDWLAGEGVAVINFSLAGPPNRIVERALAGLTARNITLVAAVGNAGPAVPPQYPAAYDGVIGVTAVDSERKVYRWANRGEQVDFAAPGVAVRTLGTGSRMVVESGTSMAAPVISAHAACAGSGASVVDLLAAKAVDLGEPGRDTTFGLGYLE